MGLFEMKDGALESLTPTSFAEQGVLERSHLQAAIREDVSVLGDDLLVIAEEFGDFADANRRIDLLCVDREARPVVVELKRTNDGGHMELQALRYAAMVSTLTLDDVVSTYERHLARSADRDSDEARPEVLAWLEDVGGEEAVIQRDVRIVLAAADFGKEITTTALWLNDVFGTDIRCVRIVPYHLEGRLLLDVQQVVPLPEAQDLTVRLRRRETAVRVVKASNRDWTPYVVQTPAGATAPLRKRAAVLAMVHAVLDAGATAQMVERALAPRFLGIDGHPDPDEIVDAFIAVYPKIEQNISRWYLEDPIFEDGRTWVLSKMWGTNTETALDKLVALVPTVGITYAKA